MIYLKLSKPGNMATSRGKIETIDEYIAQFPKNVRDVLEQFRRVIKETAPEAEETISYSMPAFKQNGILVWFAAFKNHIGFYPKVSAIQAFKEKLSKYRLSKGTIQFPLNEPVPYELVRQIVEFRVKENRSEKNQS